jgi:hypothetical protein
MIVPIRDICVEVGQIIEVYAWARNGEKDDGSEDGPSAQFTLAIYDETNTTYIAKNMTKGNERPKDSTLFTKFEVLTASDSVAICLNNEDG